jgi:hypothetical protein
MHVECNNINSTFVFNEKQTLLPLSVCLFVFIFLDTKGHPRFIFEKANHQVETIRQSFGAPAISKVQT